MMYAGTVLVALADHVVDGNNEERPDTFTVRRAVLGDILTIVAAVVYAAFTVLIKVMMPSNCPKDLMKFFGYLGAVNTVAFAPVLLLMQFAGAINVFSVDRSTWSLAVLKGACSNVRHTTFISHKRSVRFLL
jgi:drug/metabolite transporter (DMT)-like permease